MPLIDGIEVSGCPQFEYRKRQALEVLSDSEAYLSVKRSLAAIREGKSSGLAVIWGKPTFEVGCRTWQAPLIWYASAIVHDAAHAHLYRENHLRLLGFGYTPPWAWKGVEAERVCLRLQLAVLRELHAGHDVVQYVESMMEHPTYQDQCERTW